MSGKKPNKRLHLTLRASEPFRSSKKMMRRETGFLIAAIPAGFLPVSYVVMVIHTLLSIVKGTEIRPDEGGWL